MQKLRTAHMCVCVLLCTTVVHNPAHRSLIIFHLILQTSIGAQMLSIGGEGKGRDDSTETVSIHDEKWRA